MNLALLYYYSASLHSLLSILITQSVSYIAQLCEDYVHGVWNWAGHDGVPFCLSLCHHSRISIVVSSRVKKSQCDVLGKPTVPVSVQPK